MNIKYGAIFIILALMMLGGCLFAGNFIMRLAFAYAGFSLFVFGIAYLGNMPGFWKKNKNGTINPVSFLFFAPLHALNWFSLLLAVRLQNERSFHEIVPNLWLGRRLISGEADFFTQKPELAVLDLTSEFFENRRLRNKTYLCLPTLDHTAPSGDQFKQALEFIKQHISERPVYVHCALGHGRSAAVVAAWLLEQNQKQTVMTAVQQIKAIRHGVGLNAAQIAVLNALFRN